MSKTRTEKIASYGEQIKQLENQRKQLIQKEKEQERKDRTKRLCRRMGLFESLLPETITLTDEHFKTFLEKAVLSDYARKTLAGLTAQGNTAAAPIRASAPALSALSAADESDETERAKLTRSADGGEDGAEVTG